MINASINEISQNQADLIKSFAIFYLLLVGNYVGTSMFTCFQINYIKQTKWLQILISFLLFYFLVTVISYFMGFLIVMRLDMKISAFVLVLIFILYFLELNKDFYLERGADIIDPIDQDTYNSNKYWITLHYPYKIKMFKVNKNNFTFINKVETIIYYLILFLLVIGFISYGGEIHDTLNKNKNLTWVDVISDTNVCRLKDRKHFLHYLKVGLGLKI